MRPRKHAEKIAAGTGRPFKRISETTWQTSLGWLWIAIEVEAVEELSDGKVVYIRRVKKIRPAERLEKIQAAWKNYITYLKEKYPAAPGEEWKLTCPHHEEINRLLN